MTCFGGSNDPEIQNQMKRNKVAQQDLARQKQVNSSTARLLLLGTGESGKSTIFKQMKIIHKDGYDAAECMKMKDIICLNTIHAIRVLIDACEKLEIAIDGGAIQSHCDDIMELSDSQITNDPISLLCHNNNNNNSNSNNNESESIPLSTKIAQVWKSKCIQSAYERRSEYQLSDSAAYFLDQVEHIAQENYQPTRQDVLRSRVKTVGITEADFSVNNYNFKVIDVGGQRNERRKWIHVFDEVSVIIFVTSLSEYDQQLAEDHTMNRMKESLLLFDEICNCRYFRDTSIAVFFNKKDLFEEKIAKVNLNVCFSEYTQGTGNADKAMKFIEKKFLDLDKNKRQTRKIYSHFTCATDTENVKVVFNVVQNVILMQLMQSNVMF